MQVRKKRIFMNKQRGLVRVNELITVTSVKMNNSKSSIFDIGKLAMINEICM